MIKNGWLVDNPHNRAKKVLLIVLQIVVEVRGKTRVKRPGQRAQCEGHDTTIVEVKP
jgi:hypothetical protein